MTSPYRPFGGTQNLTRPLCGCWYFWKATHHVQQFYLPLHSMKAHTIIKDIASRTVLTQTFSNNRKEHIKDMVYSFPLYNGVSVVEFTATIGDVKIHGVVKEKQQARREYNEAVDKGSSAGLLEQLPEASDVFVTNIGNVPAGAKVIVEITYIGELKHDAESNGIRFTIPSTIAPRYGTTPADIVTSQALHKTVGDIQVTVDFQSPEGCHIQKIQSPSHPITVEVGRTTDMPSDVHISNRGSATLSLDTTTLEKDFVIIASIKDSDTPKALLETHATIPNQRALITTLVPRFSIAPTYGEIVFIVDRSGSMGGKMEMVIKAMTILLKSLPSGTKFNILSFGSHHSFLWPRSKSYNDASLSEALRHIKTFDANFGGTEMYQPVQDTISQRFNDMLLDAIILTDGQIWNQDNLFELIQKAATDYKCRFFSLGIGSGASTSLVEGIATAGNGVSQFVVEGERMDAKMVQLLKGALTPHIDNYSLEVKYKQEDEEFEIIDSVKEASKTDIRLPTASTNESTSKQPISFFNPELKADLGNAAGLTSKMSVDKFAHLPIISPPSILQAPCQVPPLYPFSRTTVYLLLDSATSHRTPEAVILRATCSQGPLELEIKVEDIGKGETIHQLAAKRAVSEIEKKGGWLANATDKLDGTLIKKKFDGRWDELLEREAVRLGEKYQTTGKWCSFVAVEGDIEREAVVFGEKEVPSPFGIGGHGAPGGRHIHAMKMASVSPFSRVRTRQAHSPQSGVRKSVETNKLGTDCRSTDSGPSFLGGLGSSLFGGVRKSFQSRQTHQPSSVPASSGPQLKQLRSRSSGISYEESYEESYADSYPDTMYSIITRQKSDDSCIRNTDSNADTMYNLISLQKSDGSWEWGQDILDIIKMERSLDSERQNAIVATALAIAFLQVRMAHESDSWELIVEKAKAWLGRQNGVDADKEIRDAQKLLSQETSSDTSLYDGIC